MTVEPEPDEEPLPKKSKKDPSMPAVKRQAKPKKEEEVEPMEDTGAEHYFMQSQVRNTNELLQREHDFLSTKTEM